MEIVRTRIYEKKARKLLTEHEICVFEEEIALAPQKWPVMVGTGGIRKARAARGNSGKSGGVRVMYYFFLKNSVIYLLDIYAKNEKENISESDKKILKGIIKELEGGIYG